jgi:ribonuclease HI
MSGSLRLGERLFRANIWSTPICIFCGHEEETNEHCFWQCPAWDHLRLDPDLPSFHERIALPPCTLQCGIFMRTQDELNYESVLQPIEHERSEEVPLPHAVNETFVDGAVIIWTDGACPQNQCRALRRAGCGIFYGQEHPRNKSFALRGPEQTNNRAELLACIVALEGESRPAQIRTDSQYVIDGVAARRRQGDNKDLWIVMHNILDHREQSTYSFVKVKGHAKDSHVRAGLVDPIDKVGNDAADLLAVQGAASHAPPDFIVKRCLDRMSRAKSCHRMMLKILDARRRAEQTLRGETVDDYIEESGDDPWSELSMNTPMYVPHPRSGEG